MYIFYNWIKWWDDIGWFNRLLKKRTMAFCRFLRMINPIAKHILCRWKLNPLICLVLKNQKVEFVLNFQLIDFCFILIFLISRWFSWRIPESFDHTINSWLPGNHSITSSYPQQHWLSWNCSVSKLDTQQTYFQWIGW